MKAEITLPPELVEAIADAVIAKLKPLLSSRKAAEDDLFDVAGVAAYLRVDRQRIYEWTSQNSIPFIKAGRFLRFRKSVIDRWLAEHSTPSASPPVARILR